MTDKLKTVRCGCGGEAEIVNRLSIDYGTNVWYVICRVCHIASEDYFSEAEAVEAWNKAMGATDTNVGDKIIYCKDCKYAHMTIDGLCKYCDIWFPNEEMYEDGKHFCASAEKREQ